MILYPEQAKISKPIIFDTHSHYDDIAFSGELDALIGVQVKSGLYAAITCGVDQNSSIANIELARKYDCLYAAVGIHPENLSDDNDTSFIYDLSKNAKCVAIGEIGLDYHYDTSNIQKQRDIFRKQIIIAKELDMPVIVHDRDAHADTLTILKELKPKGVLHCFSGSKEMADEIIKLGMYIGIGGVITFKNAKKLPEIVKSLPEDKILVETDCPYLAPEPFRGKICHSGLIPFTAERIAEIRGTNCEEILKLTLNNAKRLFGIK